MTHTYEEYLEILQSLGITYKTRDYSYRIHLHILYKNKPCMALVFDTDGNYVTNHILISSIRRDRV